MCKHYVYLLITMGWSNALRNVGDVHIIMRGHKEGRVIDSLMSWNYVVTPDILSNQWLNVRGVHPLSNWEGGGYFVGNFSQAWITTGCFMMYLSVSYSVTIFDNAGLCFSNLIFTFIFTDITTLDIYLVMSKKLNKGIWYLFDHCVMLWATGRGGHFNGHAWRMSYYLQTFSAISVNYCCCMCTVQ